MKQIDELDFRQWTPICYTHKLSDGEYECLFSSDNEQVFAIGVYNIYTNSAYPKYPKFIKDLDELIDNYLNKEE